MNKSSTTEKSEKKSQNDDPIKASSGKAAKKTKKDKVKVKVDGLKKKAKTTVKKEKSNESKIKELQDKYLRLSAEFDNYRKRTLREKIELTKLANEEIFIKLLPVMDDFDRAIQSMNETTDCIAMKEGIDLIYGKFKEFIQSNGVKEIDALHKSFDIDYHEAISKIPAPDKKLKGKIVDVVEKGYFLNDKVIRYSKVVIGE
ncbi:Protein GrpE [subsurface metagenome]